MSDTSGRRRDVTRFSPVKLNSQGRALPDLTGQRALDVVLSAAADPYRARRRTSDSIDVRELWKHYRDHLISLNRAGATISRYDGVPAGTPAVSAGDSVRVQGESYTRRAGLIVFGGSFRRTGLPC
ncbi:hypothetical protein [Nocardia salmonicida]|uniref:hypothetical protein n=1 Tax=Nocardia salmonicida TaxID=53431 RepID=UPI002E2826DD|nr:hypothetical protein [Nocardia salmonicida]